MRKQLSELNRIELRQRTLEYKFSESNRTPKAENEEKYNRNYILVVNEHLQIY